MLLPIPTTRGQVALIMAAGATTMALCNANLAAAMVASALAAAVTASFLLAFLSLYRFELRRGACREGSRGRMVDLPLTIVNRGWWRRQAVVIREDLPFLAEPRLHTPVATLVPRESRTVIRLVMAARRGDYRLARVSLIGGDPAGLFRRIRHFRLPAEITIYPAAVKVAWMPIRLRHQLKACADGRPLGVSGLSQEMFGVREYRPTDGVRFIHWRASARQRRLMVREFESFSVAQVGIVLDVDRSGLSANPLDSNFEYLVETASSIADYLSGMYCRVLFIAAGNGRGNPLLIEEGPSFGARRGIRELLARIEPGKVPLPQLLDEALAQLRRDSILYVLSMSEQPGVFPVFDLLLGRGVDIRWIHAPKTGFQVAMPWQRRSAAAVADGGGRAGLEPFVVARDTPIAGVLAYG